MKSKFLILAIDTSCDETSVAVTQNDWVLSNIIASQVEFHQEFGGVVPHIAKRKHQDFIKPTVKKALKRAKKTLSQVDAIAVTQGPGLAPALEVGIAYAKKLAKKHHKPLIAVNHMEGHLLSSLAKNSKGNGSVEKKDLKFPVLALLVSGGHTQLVLMKKIGEYQLLGETVDDAAGEAFDKVAKMLGLGYPGGPVISNFAKKGQPKFKLPVPMSRSSGLNFSFSGLKTACKYKLQKIDLSKKNPQFFYDFATSFEKTVGKALTLKLKRALKKYSVNQVFLGGGVINNVKIRRMIRKTVKKHQAQVFIPYSKKLFSDNAAMIGVVAWYKAQRGEFVKELKKLDRKPGLSF